MAWHQRRYANAILRLTGLALVCVAALVGRRLFVAPDIVARVSPLAYLLALIFLVSTSAGAALALLGRHLFDQVELSARWTICAPPRGED